MKMVEDFSSFHAEQLITVRDEYEKYLKKYPNSEAVWDRVNAINMALAEKEKPIHRPNYG